MKHLKAWLPVIGLALLTLIFFWKILLTNLILVGVDVFLYFYPYKAYATQALLSGRLPLWNPHIFMGVPFLANSQVGLLYPLNWLFLWANPPKQVAYSIGLHIWLAGAGAYLFARSRLNLSLLSASLGGIIFGFSGFLGAQVEHINQLQVSAWLPWVLYLADRLLPPPGDPAGSPNLTLSHTIRHLWRQRRTIGLLGLVISLMLLAGHTQSVYISMGGLGLYALFRGNLLQQSLRERLLTLWRNLLSLRYLIPSMGLALLLTAVQLLPTMELAQLSIRASGLTYNEAVSFSVNPLKSWLTILPPYGLDLEVWLSAAFGEFVAYVGLSGLVLAVIGGVLVWRNGSGRGLGLGLMGGVGLFLAFGRFTGPVYVLLYRFMPGFNLFRVPARWLLLYTFGIAMLAAIGSERVGHRWRGLLILLVVLELFIAGQSLRYNQPTAPEAYLFLRPAIVQLLAAQNQTDRFLSLSGIEYDPGDLAEINHIFADQLPQRAVYDYVVATKQKEVLFFNLPMVYGLNAIDGYDGGLLPLKRFLDWQSLFLPEENLSVDGRLREKLRRVPEGRLLSLFGVRHIITDKVQDVWLDNIFYDLQFPAHLSPQTISEVWTTEIPDFDPSAVGVVFNTPQESGQVGHLILRYASGAEEIFALEGGVGQPWENGEYGLDYNIVFERLAEEKIIVIGLQAEAEVVIRGISLIQTAGTTSRSITTLSTEGNYQRIHDGDIKLYENLDVMPRAFIVHQTQLVTDTAAAVATLKDRSFDPTQAVVRLTQAGEQPGITTLGIRPALPDVEWASITRYTPEEVTISTQSQSEGWLILMDSYYPGWQAMVDGKEVPIQEVDILFRAIELPAGDHQVVFKYRPQPVYRGAIISLIGVLIVMLCIIRVRSINT